MTHEAATTAHCAIWHLDAAEQWSVDMDSGLIVFQLPGGVVATAPVQIVGARSIATPPRPGSSPPSQCVWAKPPARIARRHRIPRMCG